MQLGFLLKLGQFFGQAEARKDPKAQGLLAHSAWHLSVTLTDVKPVAVPRVATLRGEDDVSVPSEAKLLQHHKEGRRRSSVRSILEISASQAGTRGPRNSRRRSSGGSSCAMSITLSETNTATQAAGSRSTTSMVATAARAQSAADRARISIVSSKKGAWNGVGQGGFPAQRAARGVATEKGPGTAATGVPTEEGSAKRGCRPPIELVQPIRSRRQVQRPIEDSSRRRGSVSSFPRPNDTAQAMYNT